MSVAVAWLLSVVFRTCSSPIAGVAMSAIAAWLLWDNGGLWSATAIGVGVTEFWSQRVMRNYRAEGENERLRFYKENPEYEERLVGYITENPYISREAYIREIGINEIPDWITVVNMAATVAAVVLLIIGFII